MSGIEISAATASYIAAASAAASAVVGTVGAISTGISQNQAAKYNAQVAQNNADAATQAANFETEAERRRQMRLFGAQRAAYGKAGVTMEGTPLDVVGDTAAEGELDALAILYQGQLGYNRGQSEASLQRYAGRSALTSGYIGAGSSILKGAGAARGLLAGGEGTVRRLPGEGWGDPGS